MPSSRIPHVANWVNLTTPLGLAVARIGGASVHPPESGVRLATGWRPSLPRAKAFTVGSVVISRHDREWLAARPRLMVHEERHARQCACCLGLPFFPLYAMATAWSLWRTGDRASANPFEQLAGLDDGEYRRVTTEAALHWRASGRREAVTRLSRELRDIWA